MKKHKLEIFRVCLNCLSQSSR